MFISQIHLSKCRDTKYDTKNIAFLYRNIDFRHATVNKFGNWFSSFRKHMGIDCTNCWNWIANDFCDRGVVISCVDQKWYERMSEVVRCHSFQSASVQCFFQNFSDFIIRDFFFETFSEENVSVRCICIFFTAFFFKFSKKFV